MKWKIWVPPSSSTEPYPCSYKIAVSIDKSRIIEILSWCEEMFGPRNVKRQYCITNVIGSLAKSSDNRIAKFYFNQTSDLAIFLLWTNNGVNTV